MEKCNICGNEYNVGIENDTDLICIQCLDQEATSTKFNKILSKFRTKNANLLPTTTVAKSLARHLMLSYSRLNLGFVISIVLTAFMIKGFVSGYEVESLKFWLLIASIVSYIFSFAFLLSWLSVLNNAVVANNTSNATNKILISFFIPFYGYLLTRKEHQVLVAKGEQKVSYGRLLIV